MRNTLRLIRAGFVLARAGAFGFADPAEMPPGAARFVKTARRLEPAGLADADRGRRLSEALNRLGPSYVKLGQFLATRPDIVGAETAVALSTLKDDMAPFPTATAKQIVEQTLERPVEAVFEAFSEPIAAASIAQVHKAIPRLSATTTESRGHGEAMLPRVDPVAVKILRPTVRQRFHRDLAAFFAAARLIERIVPDARRLKPLAVVETLARSVTMEMDLRLEAAALSEMAETTAEETDFRVPAVDWTLTGRDVLVTEWIDGLKLTDLNAIDAAGLDRPALACTVMQSFLRHALRDGFFHADMHEGNLFVDTEGRIAAVDLGIMGRLGLRERRFLAEILYGFIRRDYRRIAQVHFEAGYVPKKHAVDDFAQALRAIGEPIHGHKASDISMAKLLGLLFEITELFDMSTRPELLLLQKTMVVVEGVSRRLDPDFDMWTTSEPVVADWLGSQLGPAGKISDAAQGIAAIGHLANQMPELARRAERLSEALDRMGADGLRLDAPTVEAIGASQARHSRSGRVAVWAIAIAALVIAISTVSML